MVTGQRSEPFSTAGGKEEYSREPSLLGLQDPVWCTPEKESVKEAFSPTQTPRNVCALKLEVPVRAADVLRGLGPRLVLAGLASMVAATQLSRELKTVMWLTWT